MSNADKLADLKSQILAIENAMITQQNMELFNIEQNRIKNQSINEWLAEYSGEPINLIEQQQEAVKNNYGFDY